MRTTLRSRFTLLFLTFAVAMLVFPAVAFAQTAPTIQSDQADYGPGDLVTLTGSGWQAGESVNIVVNDDVGQTWSRNVNVTADASGNISDSFNLPDWFVATYTVTATGAQSGVATTSFTDGDFRFKGGASASDVGNWTVTYTTYSNVNCATSSGTGTKTISGTGISPNPNAAVGPNGSIKVTAVSELHATKNFSHFTLHEQTSGTAGAQVGTTEYEINDCVAGNHTGPRFLVGHFGLNTAISNVSGSGTAGGTATLTAKLTSNNTNLSGKTIVFSLRNNAVCDTDPATPLQACPTTGNDGVATLNNVSLSGISAGGPTGTGYEGAVKATFRHDATYAPSSGIGNLTVNPACTNPANPVFQNTPAASGWFNASTGIPTPNATTTTSGATVKYSTSENGTYDTTPPTLGQGEQTVYAKAFSSTGSCSSAAVSFLFKVDTIAPGITPGNVENTTWRNTDLSETFTASDSPGSGLAANQGLNALNQFTLTASAESQSATNPTVVSKTISDVAGNSTTRSVSALIDKTAPTITDLGPTTSPNGADWYKADVTNRFKASDSLSGLNAACVTAFPLTVGDNVQSKDTTGEGTAVNVTSDSCTDVAGNTATGVQSANFKIDKTAPQVAYVTGSATPAANTAGWNNTNVTVTFEATDSLSGMGATDANQTATNTATTSGEGLNVSVGSPAFTDRAGNTAAAGTATSPDFKIDKTKPSVSVTGVSQGGVYTTGNVPTPGCSTTDALSNVKTHATVSVTGGTGGFGTLTATCSGGVDNADNAQDAPVSVTYGVKAAFNGFLQPIDGHTVNTGKYGRTYPIKWQLRDSSGALISDATAQLLVAGMTGGQKAVACNNFTLEPEDALEESTTGNTSLRYDATSDQFIYNYKAPSSGSCYVFAIRNADGLTTQQIDFKFTK